MKVDEGMVLMMVSEVGKVIKIPKYKSAKNKFILVTLVVKSSSYAVLCCAVLCCAVPMTYYFDMLTFENRKSKFNMGRSL
jgi:hypothetical protein